MAGCQKDKQSDPAGDLQKGNDDGGDETDFGTPQNTLRRLPIADRHKQSHRCREYGKIKDDHRINRQREREAVIKHALIFQVFDFSFGLAGFQANRAEMAAIERAIAQGAEKPPATVTRQHRFFLRMVEAARFTLDEDGFALLTGSDFAEQGGKDLDLQRRATRGAWRKFGLIKNSFHQPCTAFRTLNQGIIHRLFDDDARVANAIVQSPSLGVIERGHDETNQAGETAQHFRKISAEGAGI